MTKTFLDFIHARTRHAAVYQLLIILAVGILAYSNTFKAEFNFDDISAILGNPVVRSADPLSDTSVFKGMRIIGDLTFVANYKAAAALTGNGFHVTGYHFANLAIHLLNACLVYLLVIWTFSAGSIVPGERGEKGAIAFLAALLFISHPLQTQAVTYIVQRYTSLAATFYLLAVLCYISARRSWGKSTAKAAMAAFMCVLSMVLAMKTKEIAFTLPVMIVLYELLFFRAELRKRLMLVAGCLMAMAIIPVSLIAIWGPQALTRLEALTKVQTAMPRMDYLFTQFRVIVEYLRLLFFPVGQNLDHDFPTYRSLFSGPVLLSFLLLLFLLGLAVFFTYRSRPAGSAGSFTISRPGERLIAFGIFWFFVALSVESSFIPIVDVIFEHRVYLPSVGFFIALATAMVMVAERVALRRREAAAGLMALVLLAAMVLAGITYNRNKVWADELTLWKDVAAKSPEKSRAWNNLGYAYLKKRQPKEAIPALITSINLSPGHPDAWNNIGMALHQLGSYTGRFRPTYELFDMREGNITSAYQMEWFALAYNNLGLAYDYLRQPAEAIDNFRKSIEMNPRLAESRYNLALALLAAGDREGVREQYGELQALKPELAGKLREVGYVPQ
jgi:Tfp pilus assembly protein PilF